MPNEASKVRLADGTEGIIRDDTARAAADAAMTTETYNHQLGNNFYAGRNIANIPEFASAISTAGNVYAFLHSRASAANFAGLRIFDYIEVPTTDYGTVKYRIGAFDYNYNCGDSAMPHNILLVPEDPIPMPAGGDYTEEGGYIKFNATATNQGTSEQANPYLVSRLHKWELEEFLLALPSALQSVLVASRSLVESRYSGSGSLNNATSWAWASNGKVFSPSEVEVFGNVVNGTGVYTQGLDMQLPIFKEAKNLINSGRNKVWTRITAKGNATDICTINGNGAPDTEAANAEDVRALPIILVG